MTKLSLSAVLIVLVFICRAEHLTGESILGKPAAAFARTYVQADMTKNFPISFGERELDAARAGYSFGYRYVMQQEWIVGIQVGFRRMTASSDQRQLPIFNISHESLYICRLYHPTYLLVGPKILYLLPAKQAGIPIQKDEAFATEVGVALSLQILHLVDERLGLSLRIDRWRGTKTRRLMGVEVAGGLSLPIN